MLYFVKHAKTVVRCRVVNNSLGSYHEYTHLTPLQFVWLRVPDNADHTRLFSPC